MKNNELKDELKFVNSLVQILKKNKLNTIELNRSFGEFDTVSIKVDGGTSVTSIERKDLSYPSKEISFSEETESANSKTKYFRFWAYSSSLGALLSSWFYIGLYQRFGSFTSFNMESKGLAFSNQNYSFYIPNSKHVEYLFFKPIRPHLDNQFFSILYSDLWGDYWGYFSFTSRNLALGRNQLQIGDLMARVNIISILTSLIIVSFCYLTFKKHKSSLFIRYINLAIFVSFFGYLLFAITFPTSSGDTIKSTYIIQAFHLMVFLASIYFHELEKTNKKIYYSVLFLLLGIYFHNFQTYLSHFPINYYP